MLDLIDQTQHMSSEWFFEGSEKLLELWFYEDHEHDLADLRNMPREKIEEFLNIAHCKIIGECSNEEQDAYVLSESSLFITKNRLILKTCGTTFLLNAFDKIVKLAYAVGFSDYCVFFSRRKFLCPDLQPSLHQCFSKEVKFLDKRCDNGAAYIFGKMNDQCWYLYMPDNASKMEEESQTIEIIMTDLDEEVMKIFYMGNSTDGPDATRKSAIDGLFPDAMICDYLFDPCGYSVNGLLEKDGYFTIHITPEKKFSYVSLETNAKVSYDTLVRKAISIFRPNFFFYVLMSNARDSTQLHESLTPRYLVPFYDRRELQQAIVNNYHISFASFSKQPG